GADVIEHPLTGLLRARSRKEREAAVLIDQNRFGSRNAGMRGLSSQGKTCRYGTRGNKVGGSTLLTGGQFCIERAGVWMSGAEFSQIAQALGELAILIPESNSDSEQVSQVALRFRS